MGTRHRSSGDTVDTNRPVLQRMFTRDNDFGYNNPAFDGHNEKRTTAGVSEKAEGKVRPTK